MQYQVPQFIDVEDKIVGPFTLKQFMYLAIGGAIILGSLFIFKLGFAILIAIPIGSASASLAFVRVQGVPLPRYLASLLGFAFKPQEYRWRHKDKTNYAK